MNVTVDRLDRAAPPEIATTLRNAGHAGAGGAGFPTHAKWDRLDETPFLLLNHQESEPNYHMDRWLGREYAGEFADFFDALLEGVFELIVIAAKDGDRDWLEPMTAATDATVYEPGNLPLEASQESGVVVAYTEDKYQFGMESVLLRMIADIVIRDGLPMDHGWIVQNTETMYNVMRTLRDGESMTRKLVHVDGDVPNHRFLDVPVGTPATELLAAAGRPPSTLDAGDVLLDGGPGWCFEIEDDPETFGVRKRSNCLLVLDRETVAEHTYGDGRVNVLEARDWTGDHETEPTWLSPGRVRIPLVSNPDMGHLLERSRPVVHAGATVNAGDLIAVPTDDGISNAQHASIDGRVASVSETHVELVGDGDDSPTTAVPDHDALLYWTSCVECGAYVPRPESGRLGPGTRYVCRDCQ